MIRKRSGFWTMVWALIPGAGHMFCGFMKRGVSLMGMFAAAWALAFWLNLVVLAVIAPVIWFYAFFDCLNRRFQDDEAFYSQEDCYLFTPDMLSSLRAFGGGKARIVLGGVLLALGIYVIWNNLILDWAGFLLPGYMNGYVHRISYAIPQILIAGLIIWLSIVLIRDKSRETAGDQPYSAYSGETAGEQSGSAYAREMAGEQPYSTYAGETAGEQSYSAYSGETAGEQLDSAFAGEAQEKQPNPAH